MHPAVAGQSQIKRSGLKWSLAVCAWSIHGHNISTGMLPTHFMNCVQQVGWAKTTVSGVGTMQRGSWSWALTSATARKKIKNFISLKKKTLMWFGWGEIFN